MTHDKLDIRASFLPAEGTSKTFEFSHDVAPVAGHARAASESLTLETMRAALGQLPGAVARALELVNQQDGELYEFGFVLRLGVTASETEGAIEKQTLLEQAAAHP